MKNDVELKKLQADIEEFKKAKDQTQVSLLESKRKTEREKSEARRKAIQTVNGADNKDDNQDVLLKESEKILCDLIGIVK